MCARGPLWEPIVSRRKLVVRTVERLHCAFSSCSGVTSVARVMTRVLLGLLAPLLISTCQGAELTIYDNRENRNVVGQVKENDSTSTVGKSPERPSIPNNQVYNEDKAKRLAWLSSVAYCTESSITRWSCGPCQLYYATNVSYFYDSKTTTQAFLARLPDGTPSGGDLVLSFRGTVTVTDWWLDFHATLVAPYVDCPSCKVEHGFHTKWAAVREQVMGAVLRLMAAYPQARLLVTGHSLGASLSVLAAVDLVRSARARVDSVINFGSPRTGNEEFRQYYHGGPTSAITTWRVTHWKDPVPHVPFESSEYSHVSTEVWYNEDSSSYTVCDATGEDNLCSNSAGPDSYLYVDDHDTYIGVPIDNPKC